MQHMCRTGLLYIAHTCCVNFLLWGLNSLQGRVTQRSWAVKPRSPAQNRGLATYDVQTGKTENVMRKQFSWSHPQLSHAVCAWGRCFALGRHNELLFVIAALLSKIGHGWFNRHRQLAPGETLNDSFIRVLLWYFPCLHCWGNAFKHTQISITVYRHAHTHTHELWVRMWNKWNTKLHFVPNLGSTETK